MEGREEDETSRFSSRNDSSAPLFRGETAKGNFGVWGAGGGVTRTGLSSRNDVESDFFSPINSHVAVTLLQLYAASAVQLLLEVTWRRMVVCTWFCAKTFSRSTLHRTRAPFLICACVWCDFILWSAMIVWNLFYHLSMGGLRFTYVRGHTSF